MKRDNQNRKNNRGDLKAPKLLTRLFVCAALSLLAGGCSNDPIFATIENEVALRDPTFQGTVSSLVQFKASDGAYLYASNGTIRRKPGKAAAGDWYKVSLPSGAHRCSKLVVTPDGSALYGLFQNSDWKFHSLQKTTDGTTWERVDTPVSVDSIWQATDGVYTVTLNGSGGENHAADSSTIYRVDSSGAFQKISVPSGDQTPVALCGDYIVTRRNERGDVYYVNGTSATQINLDSEGIRVNVDMPFGACIGRTDTGGTDNLYVLAQDYLYHFKGGSYVNRHRLGGSYDGFGTPAVFNGNGTPLLLLPLEEGYREARLDSSGNVTGSTYPGEDDYSSTAPRRQSQYNSSIDDYGLTAMFSVEDAEYLPDGDAYAVYANVKHYKYDGLWSYYSATEPEWNRE